MRAAWPLLGDLVQAVEARGFLLLLLAQLGLSSQENKLRLESSTELGERGSGTESCSHGRDGRV